jgi:putative pyoverdin transport system ATP-binding/permease protein
MEFIRFLRRESSELDYGLPVAGVFAGALNTVLIFLLTLSATRVAQGSSDLWDLAKVAVCLWAFWASKGHLLRRMTIIVEEIIQNVRIRLVEKVQHASYSAVEGMGRAPLFNAIASHANSISRATPGLISSGISSVLLVCAFIIIFSLSATAFLIVVATLAVMLGALWINSRQVAGMLAEVIQRDNQFVDGFGELLDGFKELKMDSEKDHEFNNLHLKPLAMKAREIRVDGGMVLTRSVLLASASLFILLAAVIFLVPVLAPDQAPKIARIATLVIFMFGPLSEVVLVYPTFNEALAAIREIERIEQRLDSAVGNGLLEPIIGFSPSALAFDDLRCEGIAFDYRDEKGQSSFSLAPFDFHLTKGELVFISGGNGSGKSTFLKVLAGLYAPATGTIRVNDTLISPDHRQSYRNIFGPIFSDFHLFDRIYGLKEVDETRVRDLLEMVELSHKTAIVNRQITTTSLSTGQRKRLALVLCLLDDKPIFLLDEWAAEQDPQFRRKFYREILPELKQQGKTIVAVTHDDDHYEIADRVLKMQFGKFVPS